MSKVRIFADKNMKIGDIDKHIYASFLEHLGRAIYEGVYEPGHPTADDDGFRQDTIDLIKELNVPMVRYPGGNFLSGYDWRDGIGPKDKRPTRLDLAWFTTETNQFGTDEFMKWCKKTGIEPMMAVNMGTGTPLDAAHLVEYCNHEGGTALSELRKANGAEKPYDVKYWCIGNEMDGPWQICHMDADSYGKKALETAKMMRWTNGEIPERDRPKDEKLKLIVCGSSAKESPTFPEWDRVVLEHTYEKVDMISMHRYYQWSENRKNAYEDYFGSADDMTDFINTIRATIAYVKAKKRTNHQVYISFDEWNIWTITRPREEPTWKKAPHILEDVYTFQDALVFAGLMNSLLNNCDIIKTACLAQLVNVIAPIMTEAGGGTLKQTSFYPLKYVANNGVGESIRTISNCDTFSSCPKQPEDKKKQCPVEARYVNESITHNPEKREVNIFVCNYDEKSRDVEFELRSFGDLKAVEYVEMTSNNLLATNTFDSPYTVLPYNKDLPAVKDGSLLNVTLPAMSWSYIKLKY